MVMVKPALPYLDVIRRVNDTFGVPTAAYQVSGEYSMIRAAARNGAGSTERVMMESLVAIRRAGADMVLTYFARGAAKLLGKGWCLCRGGAWRGVDGPWPRPGWSFPAA